MKKYLFTLCGILFLLAGCTTAEKKELYPADILAAGLQQQDLSGSLRAAEYMTDLEIGEELLSSFADEALLKYKDDPANAVIAWYLKALSLPRGTQYDHCQTMLRKAVFHGTDRLAKRNALRALFKLNTVLDVLETELLKEFFFSTTSSDEERILAAALLCNADFAAGFSWLEEILSRSGSDSAIRYQILSVLKKFPTLPSYVLRIVEKAANDPANSAAARTAAVFILLKNDRISWEDAEKRLSGFSGNESELLPLYVTFSPDGGAELIKKCAASEQEDLKQLAAWAVLKNL